jgi:uncharacterized membrane protein YkvA (DUF1232 family)
MKLIDQWKQRAKQIKIEALTVWYVSKDPNTPWWIQAFAVLLVAYAFSPIDLIPDFIPVLGYLDELILLPAGVYLLLRLTPPGVIDTARVKAQEHYAARKGKPHSPGGLAIVIAVWLVLALLSVKIALHYFHR